MPRRARSRCPRCRSLRDADGKCSPQCRTRRKAAGNRARGSAAQQGYGREHRERFRSPVLARDPVCVLCGDAPSTQADHWPRSRKELVAQGLDPDAPRYGRGLRSACHKRETARHQPGGWNRRPSPSLGGGGGSWSWRDRAGSAGVMLLVRRQVSPNGVCSCAIDVEPQLGEQSTRSEDLAPLGTDSG